jgi:chitinase
VRSAVAHHVRIGSVNLMTMDYGSGAAPHPRGRMAAYAIDAGVGAARQLEALYPTRSRAAIVAMIGLTPMIGVNDDRTEVFTLADAVRLATATRAEGFGLVSMWQLARDRACPTPERDAQTACSGIAQRPYQFAAALEGGATG